MPSPRRLRLLMLATIVGVVLILFYASSLGENEKDLKGSNGGDSRTIKDFYRKTMDGMTKGSPPGQAVLDGKRKKKNKDGAAADGSSTKERLRAAEEKAKAKANTKALRPDPPSQLVGVGNSADGQAKKPLRPVDAVEPKKDFDAKKELDNLVKDRTVVIFSKTTCPFSKHAKGILLEKYRIEPEPLVVELDTHDHGRALQDELYRRTQQRTVPNIIINDGSGNIVSLGGSDDMVELDNAGALARKFGDVSKGRAHVKLRRLAVSRRRI
ncbi:hypothetical protein CP532_1093 [Ophiocordyceps camponoti-leonardi (nom. inval.)]|nr:hypothetical protein CP532_1093 [Ophiocordyceps camponoti-leonardi (nom. inval.)]